MRKLLIAVLAAILISTGAAAQASANYAPSRWRAFDGLRGRAGSGSSDDDIHAYGVSHGLAGFWYAPYWKTSGDTTFLVLRFVTWQNQLHETCSWSTVTGAGLQDGIYDRACPWVGTWYPFQTT